LSTVVVRVDKKEPYSYKLQPMKLIRTRMVFIGLFSLISVGQAYPFSLAWGMTQTQHSCCCSGVTKPCECHHQKGKMSCHKIRDVGYSKSPCGGKTEAQVLSFQEDPFIPSQVKLGFYFLGTQETFVPQIFLPSLFLLPEGPPPKSLL